MWSLTNEVAMRRCLTLTILSVLGILSCKAIRPKTVETQTLQPPPKSGPLIEMPLAETTLTGVLRKDGQNLELVDVKNKVTYANEDLKLLSSELTQFALPGFDGSYPMLTMKKSPESAFVEYSVCQNEKCIEDFSTEDWIQFSNLRSFDELKSLDIKLRVCVESSSSKTPKNPCAAWINLESLTKKKINFQHTTHKKIRDAFYATQSLKQTTRKDGLAYIRNIKEKAVDTNDPEQRKLKILIAIAGEHKVAESFISKASDNDAPKPPQQDPADRDDSLSLASDVAETLCYTRADYNKLSAQQKCQLDRKTSNSRILKTKDEWFWDDNILCQSIACIDVLGCVSKISIQAFYLNLSGSKCISREKRLKYTIAGSALLSTGVLMVGGGVLAMHQDHAAIKIGGGLLAASGLAVGIGGLVLTLRGEGYFLSTPETGQNLELLKTDVEQLKESYRVLESLLPRT